MKIRFILFTLAAVLVNFFTLTAQNSKAVWKPLQQPAKEYQAKADGWARNYKAYNLSPAEMQNCLGQAPEIPLTEINNSSYIFYLPMPDGNFTSFRLIYSPVMEKGLADHFPGIKTYAGQGIDDPTATMRCDMTQFGFHAMIMSANGSVFIDPIDLTTSTDYVCYFKKDALPHGPPQQCLVDDEEPANFGVYSLTGNPKAGISGKLRTYRLALACTGEYAAYFGGTKPGALASMVTSMNRVNGVYERELGIHMNIIANDTVLIYTNANTDPYTNSSGSAMLTQNQTTCTNLVGSANYDMGHVFSTGGGGIAYRGCVCSSGNKARGVTGSPDPLGDAYDIDYVAHEMGHQFGANHSFNSTTGSCGGGNRASTAAYEVGSGTTVMAYAGICSPNDVQPHSDDYFHTKNFDEIVSYSQTGTGNACPVTTSSTNHIPVLTMPSNYTIPLNTPFKLTATATDPDNNALTYCWEEYDLGPACNWNAPSGNAPIFRSFNPVTTGTRLFPKLYDILYNTMTIGEIKPSYSRNLSFRCTVRDNQLTGAGVVHNDTPVTVTVSSAGPFAVTNPNTTGVNWPGVSTQTVTWSVNGTDQSPVNTSQVNVKLSIDGGQTFPFLCGNAVPNNGSFTFVVPNNQTTHARIMVEAVGNIYFDINNADFTISQPIGIGGLTFSSSINVNPNPTTGNLSLTMENNERGLINIMITSITGQVIESYALRKDYETLKQDIDLSQFAPGIYFIGCYSDQSSAVKKIVKN